ncbi:hypothetical protein ACLOJK_007605 [Asimina triloba]
MGTHARLEEGSPLTKMTPSHPILAPTPTEHRDTPNSGINGRRAPLKGTIGGYSPESGPELTTNWLPASPSVHSQPRATSLPINRGHPNCIEELRLPLRHRVREVIDELCVPLPRKGNKSLEKFAAKKHHPKVPVCPVLLSFAKSHHNLDDLPGVGVNMDRGNMKNLQKICHSKLEGDADPGLEHKIVQADISGVMVSESLVWLRSQ